MRAGPWETLRPEPGFPVPHLRRQPLWFSCSCAIPGPTGLALTSPPPPPTHTPPHLGPEGRTQGWHCRYSVGDWPPPSGERAEEAAREAARRLSQGSGQGRDRRQQKNPSLGILQHGTGVHTFRNSTARHCLLPHRHCCLSHYCLPGGWVGRIIPTIWG